MMSSNNEQANETQDDKETTMNATLNSMIRYENGYIEVIDSLDEPHAVAGAELVESGCKGWGESNAVVRYEGSYYLATV
jgi:hypothetical protein